MSGRVLGQYDVLIAEDEELDEQDLVYYVGPNIVSLERRHGFPPREFRLWIAIHEMTHRAQFTGVPWLRGHFLGLVERGLSAASLDPHDVVLAFRRAASEIRAGRNPLAESGIVGVVASDEQLAMLREIQALMSVLEGHGDVTMTRASMGVVPGAERFARVLSARRNEARGASRLIQQLVGVDAKLRQYAEGERFIEALEVAGGQDLVRRLFEGPEMFPNIAEVRQPRLWIERVEAAERTAETRRLEAPSSS